MMQDNNNSVMGQDGIAQFADVKLGAVRVGFLFAFCFLMASYSVPALVPATLHSLLLVAASISALIAGLRLEHPYAPLFTRWDEAMILLFLSFVALKFVDVEAAKLAIESMTPTGVAEGETPPS